MKVPFYAPNGCGFMLDLDDGSGYCTHCYDETDPHPDPDYEFLESEGEMVGHSLTCEAWQEFQTELEGLLR